MAASQGLGRSPQPQVQRSIFWVRAIGCAAWLLGLGLFAMEAIAGGDEVWHYAFAGYYVALFVFAVALASIPRRRQARADAEWARQLQEQAIRDDLTGLYNRRYFNGALEQLAKTSAATGSPLTLALVDLNEFKAVNDRFGHLAGDLALQIVAECIVSAVGEMGIVARIGGDEFAVLMPGVEREQGAVMATRLRTTLDATPLLLGGPMSGSATIRAAVGLVSATSADELRSERLLQAADHALYEDKAALGRATDRRKAG
ncbi:MAG: GGDEF domain-containing protein [Dehalococcoidia bacterium]